MPPVVTGLDVLAAEPAVVGRRTWALLANHAALTADLEPARAVLARRLPGTLVRLFAPEHGIDGIAQDMEAVDDARDDLTGVAVRSLYRDHVGSLEPGPEDLAGVEVVVVDLPDIGTRHYTFAASMDLMMAACAPAGVAVVVLDRPNPIGGVDREGGLVTAGCESFVSRTPTPVRHGLTLGEIALLLQRQRYPGLELTVVEAVGWRRSQWLDETGLAWVPPSPNMPTLSTAALYPGLCLIEATTLSEGRGTTRPFHLVGAPWLDGVRLTGRLRDLDLPGVAFRAARFRPMFGKHAGEACSGVELFIRDRRRLRPLALGLELIAAIRELAPEDFSWRTGSYEFSHVPAIDLLTGSPDARGAIDGHHPLAPLLDRWQREVAEFTSGLDGILIYHDE